MGSSVMYVVADREYTRVKEAGYQDLHISEEDKDNRKIYEKLYAACTGQEGAHCQYIGLVCFDVYFVEGGRLVSLASMEESLQTYDVLFADAGFTSKLKVENPEMMMAKQKVLMNYCEWLQVSDGLPISFHDWAKEQGLSIGYVHVEQIDTERMQKMYRVIEEITKDIVRDYQNGRTLRLPKLDPAVGADGRMPVWICWWQGEAHAPEIVKKCLRSIRENLPEDKADIRVITFENYNEYVFFSDSIVKRFHDGALSLTHLSDVLRAQLLCRYGGLWLDATCLLWDKRSAEILLQYPFYTRKQGGASNELDVVSGRWATYLVKGPANFSLFGFWVEAFEAYWEKYDSLLNYFIFDYITAVAYDNLAEVKWILDAVPVNNMASEVLSGWCNKPFDRHNLELLTSQNWLFKMTYKMQMHEKTPQGEDTFYHVVMNRWD